MKIICSPCAGLAVSLEETVEVAGIEGTVYVCPHCGTPLVFISYNEMNATDEEANQVFLSDQQIHYLSNLIDKQADKLSEGYEQLTKIRRILNGE